MQLGRSRKATYQLLAYADDVNVLGDNNIYCEEKHGNFN
jgi:hypothetical protein